MARHMQRPTFRSVGDQCRRLVSIVVVLLGALAFTAVEPNTVAAQQTAPVSLAGYQSGMVTSVQGNGLGINGAIYQLSPDVVIVDPEDKPMEPVDIRVNAEVKFQVKREQANRIIRMILILPQ